MSDVDKNEQRWLALLIAALVGGSSATGVQMLTPMVRNDHFSGEMGKQLAAALGDKIIAMGIRTDRLETRLDSAMEKLADLPPRSVLATIAELKAEILVMKAEQRNLEDLINTLTRRERK